MRFRKPVLWCLLAIVALGLPLHLVARSDELNVEKVKQVLLISVDGLHALDLTNYVESHHDSALAALWKQGITCTNNSTSQPSDSFRAITLAH